jgi:hypothetical protein
MTEPTRHTCHDRTTAAGPDWQCPHCSALPAEIRSSDQPLDLDQIETRAAAASKGPWRLSDDYTDIHAADGEHLASYCHTTDGEFIAHARTDVPAMAAEIRRLRAELAAARVQSLRDLADKADPQRPDISFFGDHGHTVGAWIRKQAEYEERRLAAEETHVVADAKADR